MDYKLSKYSEFVTGETRALNSKYSDPLFLNFKIIIDFDNSPLLRDENQVNSALAYLKRIGQTERYNMMLRWIEMFKIFIRDYDFLVQQVEGLDIIQNKEAGHFFTENDKVSFTVRETSDIFFQSLLTIYRQIWFDDIRCVQVIPSNLLKFNCSVLVYSAGYYNMLLYDNPDVANAKINELIYPTLRKLSDKEFSSKTMEQFNHQLYIMESCSINNEESGKTFAASLTNEQSSEFIMNTLSINFRFASYRGRFNNIMGYVDFAAILAIFAAQGKINNTVAGSATTEQSFVKKFLEDQKQEVIREAKNIKGAVINTINTKIDKIPDKIFGSNTVIGNFLSKLTVQNAGQLIKNTIDLGIGFVEDKLINDPITKINNLLFQNFSNDIYNLYKNNFSNVNPNITLEENNVVEENIVNPGYTQKSINVKDKGVVFGKSNIYNRKGF